MVNLVDPFVIPIPRALQEDPEVRFYHEYLNKFLHDLWIRTGGGNDNIADEGIKELYPWQSLTDEELESVAGIYGRVNSDPNGSASDIFPSGYLFGRVTEGTEILAVSVDYTTTGDQVLICTNAVTITVTLNPSPADGEQVHIKRQNTGTVIISGMIDGATSITPISRYDSPHLIYTVDAGEWSIV